MERVGGHVGHRGSSRVGTCRRPRRRAGGHGLGQQPTGHRLWLAPSAAEGAGRDRPARARRARPLQDQVADGGGEARVGAHGGRAAHRQAPAPRPWRWPPVSRSYSDLHVVGDEADGGHHHRGGAGRVPLLQVVADVGLEPRDVRGAASGTGRRAARGGRRRRARGPRRRSAGRRPGAGARTRRRRRAPRPARRCRRRRSGWSGWRTARCAPSRTSSGSSASGPRATPSTMGSTKPGVVEVVRAACRPAAARQPSGSRAASGVREVLAVLAAAGVGGVGAGGEDQRRGGGRRPAISRRVSVEVRGPVAVAPVDRQVQAVLGEVLAQGVQQGPVLVVDGADAAEEEVVLADLLEAFLGDAAAARSRSPGTGPRRPGLGAAEREQQQGVVGAGIEHVWHAPDPATRH